MTTTMTEHDEFFMGESAPVSELNTARDMMGRMSQIHTARERRLSQDGVPRGYVIKENQSTQSFDSNQSELYDVVVPLISGIRRNAMDSHDISTIETLVFTDPIFQRHRKQSAVPFIVVSDNDAMNSTTSSSDTITVSPTQIVSCTNFLEDDTATLSMLPSGDITPTLTPFQDISTNDSLVRTHYPNGDAVLASISQASQTLLEKFDIATTNLDDNIVTFASMDVPEENSPDITHSSTIMYQSLCDRERENRLLDDHDAIIAKMIMGSSRCKVKPSSSSSSSSFSSSSLSTAGAVPSASLISKGTIRKLVEGGNSPFRTVLYRIYRAILMKMSLSVIVDDGDSAKVVVDDSSIDTGGTLRLSK